MYYFIPSWYGTERFWQADQAPWYFSTKKFEFDDSLHQIRLFQEEGQAPQVLMLSYQPHLRYFLHRHDLFEVAHFSVFDAIQDLSHVMMRPLQVTDLDWDRECDFIYTPFALLVEKAGQRFAEVEFGVEGFISLIRYFDQGQLGREEVFDDRGLVSSILYYEKGQASHRHYLNGQREWQICEYLDGRGIVVNDQVAHRFAKSHYEDMAELVWEFLLPYLETQIQPEDVFVLASNPKLNSDLYAQLPQSNPKILSLFEERNGEDDLTSYEGWLEDSQLVISDGQELCERLYQLYPGQASKCHQMVPYDTRLALGMSQRVKESNMFCQLDLPYVDWEAIKQVLAFLAKDKLAQVTFASFNAKPDQLSAFEDQLKAIIEADYDMASFEEMVDKSGAENQLEENKEVRYRFSCVTLVDERDLIKALEYTRLILDFSPEPNRYTQIAGISAGIPQINVSPSDYVSHLENGYILEDITDFEAAANYYLGQLKHWNQALIFAIAKIKAYTGDQLIQKWENWLKEEADA